MVWATTGTLVQVVPCRRRISLIPLLPFPYFLCPLPLLPRHRRTSPFPTMTNTQPATRTFPDDDAIDFAELIARLRRGLPATLGLGLLGLAVAVAAYFAAGAFLTVNTSTRVVFSFPGYENGEYPDKSRFQPDDLRAPTIVAEALKHQGLETTEEFQGKVRGSLSIEGLIPANIVKERDRLRAAGQALPRYVPDEYTVTLSLPRSFPLSSRQREQFLRELVSVFQERFQRTYVELPHVFGNALDSLDNTDYFDFELVLNQESQNLNAFLAQMSETARTFRSPRTNLSFGDLLKQAQLFTQLRLNETLGLIRQFGLSKDRGTALAKLDYYYRTLEDQVRRAVEEEKVVQALLDQTSERMQNYVLGVRSQAAQQRSDAPIIDQGLVDSLLANDAYNFLVRQALEAGLKTKRLQSQIAILGERRDLMKAFSESAQVEQSEVLAQMEKSLAGMTATYASLITDIRRTHEDYQRQIFGNAISLSMQAKTESFYRQLAMAGFAGLATGIAAGLGLSLLRPVPVRSAN